ncbi:fatty acid--CoA ligase [soil metagenome]
MPLKFAEVAPQYNPTGLLVRHLLEGALLASPAQEIVYRGLFRCSYAEMGERVHKLASALGGIGVVEGSVVAVMDWDSHRYLEAYFAIPMMGAVLQTANVRLSKSQLIHCLRSTGATHLIYHSDFSDLVSKIIGSLPDLQTRIIISDDGGLQDTGAALEYEAMVQQAEPDYSFVDFDENALATTFHTTGTTGLPKAVQFSHRQLVLHALALSGTLALQPDGQGFRRHDVYMPLTPMFHVHAWGLPYVATMIGVKQVYPGRYQPETILDLKINEGATFSHCVPTVLQMVLDEATRRNLSAKDLSPWTMLIGGSALTRTLQEAASALGITTLAGYGMSETGPVIAISRSTRTDREEAGTDLRNAGRQLPLVKAMVLDAGGLEQPCGVTTGGELVLRAPWLTASYSGDFDASADLWEGGWMRTQDIATISADGTIEIRDRLKDVIKSGGEWISSVEIEAILLSHESVDEAAVIGTMDAKWGERPVAILVGSGGNAETNAALMEILADQAAQGVISRFAIPASIIWVTQIPKTSVGKIDKKALRLASLAE